MSKARAFTKLAGRIALITAILTGVPAALSAFLTLEFDAPGAWVTGALGGGTLYVESEIDALSTGRYRPLEWHATVHGPYLDNRYPRWPVQTGRKWVGGMFRRIVAVDIRLWAIALVSAGIAGAASFATRGPRDPAKCTQCGYDVTGLAGEVCPECGSVVARVHRG